MQTTQATSFRAASLLAVLGAAGFLTSQLVPSVSAPVGAASVGAASAVAAVAKSAAAGTRTAAAAVVAVAASPSVPPAVALATPVTRVVVKFATDKALRAQIKWVPVRYGGEQTQTLDETSRLLLAQAAAEKAGLQQVGLGYQDVYGVIQAETSWVPRHVKGKNGFTSLGLAQFEPRTARGLGLKDPHDPVQAVY